jgi:outer membrane immunogenic protein
VSIRFVATQAHETPGNASFFLTGGAADAAMPILPRLSAAVEVAGTTTARVPSTLRGLSTITLLAGPRFTQPMRHISLSAEALFGAVRGFDADFTNGTNHADNSTTFAFAAGGFVDVPLTHLLALRAVQIDYLQNQLPNGADNRQGDLRVGAGLVFHIALPSKR